jgi:protein-L-isoaspartate O-methyltransferase
MLLVIAAAIGLASVVQASAYLNTPMPQAPSDPSLHSNPYSFGLSPQSPSQPEANASSFLPNARIQLYPAPLSNAPASNPFSNSSNGNAQSLNGEHQQSSSPNSYSPPSQTNSSLSPQMPDFSRNKDSGPVNASLPSSLPNLAAAFNHLALDPAVSLHLLERLFLLNPKFYAPQLSDSALASQFSSDARMLSIVHFHSHSHKRRILQIGVGSGYVTAALALLSHSADQITATDTDYKALAPAWEHLNTTAGPLMSNGPAKRINISHVQNSDYSDLPNGPYDTILITQPLPDDTLPPEIVKRAKSGTCLIAYIAKNDARQQLKLAHKTDANSIIIEKVMDL